MRHRRRSRVLGRSPSHRRALLRNLASALFLTEREIYEGIDQNAPKVKGRIVTTLQKAKEVRPLVEKCITIARRSLQHADAAQAFATDAERGSEAWKQWRQGDGWKKWNQAIAPQIAARRRVLELIGDKQAVSILFDKIAPRYEDRDGGYTRILKLAKPRLGDAGDRAILEFVGIHDRGRVVSERPAFGGSDAAGEAPADSSPSE
jgi:large subunit ribosomal protein L17